MRHLRLFPENTHINFVRYRHIAVTLSLVVIVAAFVMLFTRGLNFGIDFRGGVTIEVTTPDKADVAAMRAQVGALGLGEVQIQEIGTSGRDVLIRIGQGENGANEAAVSKIRAALGEEVEYQRVEIVGPQVSGELVRAGIQAVVIAMALMFVYIWFRFEWQFGVGAILSLVHDVLATILIFSVLQVQFDLATIAAILTVVGYSMNDKVVVFDRVRENLRKYKKMDLGELIDRSINETMSRTLMTGVTTLIALFSLFIFGGEVIRTFTFAMIFGVFVGTYSSIYVGTPFLMAIGVSRDWSGVTKSAKTA